MAKRPSRILFLCTGNTCRSAMAEQLLRRRLEQAGIAGVEIQSAGVAAYPGMSSPSPVFRVLERHGIDGRGHRSKMMTRDLIQWADLILTMEEGHRQAVLAQFPRAGGKMQTLKAYVGAGGAPDVPDPIGESQDVYDACAAEIDAALRTLLEKLKDPAEGKK